MRSLCISLSLILFGCTSTENTESRNSFDAEAEADRICACLNILSPAIEGAQLIGDTIYSEAMEELQGLTTQLLRESRQCLDKLEIETASEQDIAIEKAVIRKCGMLYDLVLKETN